MLCDYGGRVRLSLFPPLRPATLAAADTLAIAAFAAAGIVSHTGAVSLRAVAEDVVPLLAGWFAAAALTRLYRARTVRALLLTWAVGIPAGVAVRAAALGRLDEPRQLAFLATTLVLTLAFVASARLVLSAATRAPA